MAKLRPKQIATEAANPGDVLTWNGTDWAPAAGGGGSVPPLTFTYYVDLNSTASSPDGSIGKPFATIQAAIDFAALGGPGELHAHIILAPGTYTETVVYPSMIISSLSLAAVSQGLSTSGQKAAYVNGSVTVDGSESGNQLFLQDCDVNDVTCQTIQLVRSKVLSGVTNLNTAILMDGTCAINPGVLTSVLAQSFNLDTDQNTPSGQITPRIFDGSYLVTMYVIVLVTATTGNLDINLTWTDPQLGSTTKSGLTVDLTTVGSTSGTFLVKSGGNNTIDYALAESGVTGDTPQYLVHFAVSNMNRWPS